MSIGEPFVEVACDAKTKCKLGSVDCVATIEVMYGDDDDMERALREAGWAVNGDEHFCAFHKKVKLGGGE